MANCKQCDKHLDSISFVAHEAEMTRMERASKRQWIVILVLIAALILTNGAWIVYENQFADVVTTIDAQQDGSGANIISGGDVDYGAESEDNSQEESKKDGR